MNQTNVINQGRKMASEVLDAGMFWRGNLAKAVKRRDFKGTLWGVLAMSFFSSYMFGNTWKW